eukprot:3113285-Rhodomonas_salina.1
MDCFSSTVCTRNAGVFLCFREGFTSTIRSAIPISSTSTPYACGVCLFCQFFSALGLWKKKEEISLSAPPPLYPLLSARERASERERERGQREPETESQRARGPEREREGERERDRPRDRHRHRERRGAVCLEGNTVATAATVGEEECAGAEA